MRERKKYKEKEREKARSKKGRKEERKKGRKEERKEIKNLQNISAQVANQNTPPVARDDDRTIGMSFHPVDEVVDSAALLLRIIQRLRSPATP